MTVISLMTSLAECHPAIYFCSLEVDSRQQVPVTRMKLKTRVAYSGSAIVI